MSEAERVEHGNGLYEKPKYQYVHLQDKIILVYSGAGKCTVDIIYVKSISTMSICNNIVTITTFDNEKIKYKQKYATGSTSLFEQSDGKLIKAINKMLLY